MPDSAEPAELLGRYDFEVLRIEIYGHVDGRKVVITHTGKTILNTVLTPKETNPKTYLQKAFDNVFFWWDDVGVRTALERDDILGTLERYATTLSRCKISPSPSIVWESDIEGHHIRYTRHWHPSRFIVRTYCSAVQPAESVLKRDGITLDSEVRLAVFYELPPNKQPLARDVVIGDLLMRIRQQQGQQ